MSRPSFVVFACALAAASAVASAVAGAIQLRRETEIRPLFFALMGVSTGLALSAVLALVLAS